MDEKTVYVQSGNDVDRHQPHDSLRQDLDAGLRFLHVMGMQTKHDIIELTSRLFALIEELVANGLLDLRRFDERRDLLWEREEIRIQERAHVQVTDIGDKYRIEDLPQIDCQSRISLCKARCCKFIFPLSFQDLDERIVHWDYSTPYQLRRRSDSYCVHNDSSCWRCTVYEMRPALCRLYDCRNDERIWIDFDRRILAPENGSGRPMQPDV
jgi:Fe-S-cluster containining protein